MRIEHATPEADFPNGQYVTLEASVNKNRNPAEDSVLKPATRVYPEKCKVIAALKMHTMQFSAVFETNEIRR